MAAFVLIVLGWLAAMVVSAVMAIAGIWYPVLFGYAWIPPVVIPFGCLAYAFWKDM